MQKLIKFDNEDNKNILDNEDVKAEKDLDQFLLLFHWSVIKSIFILI